MNDACIKCPNCGTEIPVSQTLAAHIRGELEVSMRREEAQRLAEAVQAAEARVRGESGQALRLMQEQLTEQQEKTREAQQAELALRKEKTALEERARELDLEVARRVDAEKQRLEENIRRTIGEEQSLKVREKDKQIEDLKKLVEEMKRKSEQGSQELQGEVLELDLESVLTAGFPADRINPVKKGARGADLIHEVRNDALQPCGTIVWEAKNAKNWSPAWIAKLKDDQRAAGAELAVLVTTALPECVQGFAWHEGVWVADRANYVALAIALRQQLIEVAHARAVSTNMGAKVEQLYRYLSGPEFRGRVEAIVEAFTALKAQLNRERAAMEKQWAEREKQLDRVLTGTTGMYGALAGILGQDMQRLPALEFEPDTSEEGL